jgi:HAD superfamily hydrolase (TIGR01490 family)
VPNTQGRAAAFFDLDKTVIATSSTSALTGLLLREGITTRRAVLRSVYAQASYQFGRANATQTERLRDVLGRLVVGWDPMAVSTAAVMALDELIAPQVFVEAAELIAEHKLAGRDVVIVSASGKEVVEPIATMLGADHCLATRMEVSEGRYTGSVAFFNYGPAKVEAIMELAQREGYDLETSFAYSDSITDIPMLEAVGHAAVVNPSRALRDQAEVRGWDVVRFATPPPIRKKRAKAAATGVSALVGPVILVTVAWVVARRLWRFRK